VARFHYRAIATGGKIVEGVMDAPDEASLVAQLRRQGSIVMRASPERLQKRGGLNLTLLPRKSLTRQEITNVTSELAAMLGAGQDLDRALQRFTVHALTVNAEHADALQDPALQRAFHEQVPARHHVNRRADRQPQRDQDHRIARPAVVGCEQDAVAGVDRRLQPVGSDELVRLDAVTGLEIPR